MKWLLALLWHERGLFIGPQAPGGRVRSLGSSASLRRPQWPGALPRGLFPLNLSEQRRHAARLMVPS